MPTTYLHGKSSNIQTKINSLRDNKNNHHNEVDEKVGSQYNNLFHKCPKF